jgi:regulatory protein
LARNQKSVKEKVAHYCALQERSQQQVREKLNNYGIFGEDAEEILTDLIMHGFINEERFARAYVRGKFRMKKWGRNKISQGLYRHRISDYCSKKGFEEIDEEDYHHVLNDLFLKYLTQAKDDAPWILKNKASRYLIGKGFEPPIVYDLVNSHWKDDLK